MFLLLLLFYQAKILFCYPPPSEVSEQEFNEINFKNTIEMYRDRPKAKAPVDGFVDSYLEEVPSVQMFSKQPTGRNNYSRFSTETTPVSEGKSSKKHYKMNKKK